MIRLSSDMIIPGSNDYGTTNTCPNSGNKRSLVTTRQTSMGKASEIPAFGEQLRYTTKGAKTRRFQGCPKEDLKPQNQPQDGRNGKDD